MRSMINDSEEFQAALIYPERARPKRGVSPRWRTLAIIGWIVVGILTALTALSARGADFAPISRCNPQRPTTGRRARQFIAVAFRFPPSAFPTLPPPRWPAFLPPRNQTLPDARRP